MLGCVLLPPSTQRRKPLSSYTTRNTRASRLFGSAHPYVVANWASSSRRRRGYRPRQPARSARTSTIRTPRSSTVGRRRSSPATGSPVRVPGLIRRSSGGHPATGPVGRSRRHGYLSSTPRLASNPCPCRLLHTPPQCKQLVSPQHSSLMSRPIVLRGGGRSRRHGHGSEAGLQVKGGRVVREPARGPMSVAAALGWVDRLSS